MGTQHITEQLNVFSHPTTESSGVACKMIQRLVGLNENAYVLEAKTAVKEMDRLQTKGAWNEVELCAIVAHAAYVELFQHWHV